VRHNLFRFATSELSHSAFWAWIFQSLDSTDEKLKDVRQLASGFLNQIGVKTELKSPIEVQTELTISKGQRIDIMVRDSTGVRIAIENKVSAIPTEDQLNKYLSTLEEETTALYPVLLSTSFDVDISIPVGWSKVTLEHLVPLSKRTPISHPLLSDYAEWLRTLSDYRANCERDSLGPDGSKRNAALKTAEGQWALMSYLTEGMAGIQYRGVNTSGRPWTQFRFSHLKHRADSDALFYRIDLRAQGNIFSLAQYQKPSYPSMDRKLERFLTLQDKWFSAWSLIDRPTMIPQIKKPRKTMETEMIRFAIDEISPSDLKYPLRMAHRDLVAYLEREGWPMF
jgi:hypothetical protein